MYRISKEFAFSASHVLDGLPEGHQCGRLHGHNYVVVLTLEADHLDPDTGFVKDYGELSEFKRFIDDHLDHRHLNDVLPFAHGGLNPTAELLARALFGEAWARFGSVVAEVAVSETPKTWAVYRP